MKQFHDLGNSFCLRNWATVSQITESDNQKEKNDHSTTLSSGKNMVTEGIYWTRNEGRVFQIEEFVSKKKVQKGPVFLKIKKYFCVARCRVERWWEMREVGRVTSG